MKKSMTKRIFSLIVMFALVFTTIVSTPLDVRASETNGTFVALPDDTTPRFINIWKYHIDSMNNAGDRGDGTLQTVTQVPLPGVVFEIIRVNPINGAALVCPIRNVGAWEADPTFTPQQIVTGTNGLAQLALGTPNAPAITGAVTSISRFCAISLSFSSISSIISAAVRRIVSSDDFSSGNSLSLAQPVT